jgi:hypothetical protein
MKKAAIGAYLLQQKCVCRWHHAVLHHRHRRLYTVPVRFIRSNTRSQQYWPILWAQLNKSTPCLHPHYTRLTVRWQAGGRIHQRFLNLDTSCRWVVSFPPLPLYPGGKSPQYPLDRRLSGPQSRSGPYGDMNIFDPTGTRAATTRSDWVTAVLDNKSMNTTFDPVLPHTAPYSKEANCSDLLMSIWREVVGWLRMSVTGICYHRIKTFAPLTSD